MLLNRRTLFSRLVAAASWACAPPNTPIANAFSGTPTSNSQAQTNLPRVDEQSAPAPSTVVAYKGICIPLKEFGNTRVPVACWFPAKDKSIPSLRTNNPSYAYRISVRRIGQLLAGWNFIPGLVQRDFLLKPARGGVYDGTDCEIPHTGPVILLAHGYLGSRFDLSHLAEALAAEGFTCFSAEYPESLAASYDRMDGLDRSVINNQLLRFMEQDLGIQSRKYGIIGHSLGCGTVLRTGDESWTRVMIAGSPRNRDGSPIPGNFLSVSSMNDGAVSPARFGGVRGYPNDIAILKDSPDLGLSGPIPSRSAILYDRPDAPNHISFLSESVNDAMIDFLSALLPVAKAFEIPLLDFDRYQDSRDSQQTAKLVHPLIVRYMKQEMGVE